MDSSFIVKPRAGASGFAPRDPVPVRETTATELDPSRTVAAPGQGGGDGTGKHGERGKHDEPASGHTSPEVVVDPDNRDLMFRERDVRTAGREHPGQALLRQRAYLQNAGGGELPAASDTHADIEA
jgi:hypothetical protein